MTTTAVKNPAATVPTTASTTAPTNVPTNVTSTRRPLASLVGGLGGLAFAASVVIQNVLRASFPANDASPNEVISYYADHHGVTIALAILYPIGAVGLASFIAGYLSRVAKGVARLPAIAGLVGTVSILSTFTMLVALDTAISGYVHAGSADPSVVGGLWVLHNAVFGVLLTSIGIALTGFTLAGVASGLLGRSWRLAGPAGGALLVGAAMTTPAIIAGSPTMFIGVAGFAVWLAFVATSAVKMLRDRQSA
jgi:hypothetical protein